MEILSTGQKIKRARIYKGITLKELCKDKISISKMSCIENGKVKADNDTIRYIADIIQVDYDYLVQDIYEQIVSNLETIKNVETSEKELEENVNINLSYAIEYKYNDLALELLHILFLYYIKNKKFDKCENLIPKYYTVYEKCNSKKATITYYLDIAKYLFEENEFYEAIVYYSRLREFNILDPINGFEDFAKVTLLESICYYNLKEYGKAYELLKVIINLPEKKDYDYSEIYEYYAASCIVLSYGDSDTYIKKTIDAMKGNKVKIAVAKNMFAKAYFEKDNKEKGLKAIKEAMNEYPETDLVPYVEFVNSCIETLLNNEEYESVMNIIDINLNKAISTNNIRLIEKSYYLKGMLLKNLKRFTEAEMYLNLALDALYKFGSKKERRARYLDMAHLYYQLNNYKDAIKYLNFAVDIEKAM